MFKLFSRSIVMYDAWEIMDAKKILQASGSILLQSVNSIIKLLAPLSLSKSIELVMSDQDTFKIPVINTVISEEALLYISVSLNVIAYAFPYINKHLIANLEEDLGEHYTKKLIYEIQALPYPEYLKKTDEAKNYFNLIMANHMQMPTSFFTGTVPFVVDYALGTALIWKLIGKEFGIGFLLYAPGNVLITQLLRKMLAKIDPVQLSKDMDIAGGEYMSELHTVLDNTLLLRLANTGNYEANKISLSYNKFSRVRTKSVRLEAIWQMCGLVPVLGLNIMVAVLINHGGFELSEVFKLVFLIQYSLMILPTINVFNNKISQAMFVASRIDAIKQSFLENNTNILLPPPKNPVIQNQEMFYGNADIEFKNVNFGYENNKLILKNISFVIEKNKKTALVGPSGCGKSTIINLLLRLYMLENDNNNEYQQGIISFGGININDINLTAYRKLFGVVSQKTELFPHDTLRYNILYSSTDDDLLSKYHHSNWQQTSQDINNLNAVSYDYYHPPAIMSGNDIELKEAELKIHAAAKMARLNITNDEPGAAAKLSGGETQRLGIARLIARNSPIFIFDEPTSALDSITESEIMENINSVSQGKTTIMIAHRLSTIKNADKIIVFGKDGTLREQGTHQELIDKGGEYAAYWYKQT